LPNLLKAEEGSRSSSGGRPSIKNCITIFLVGSPGQNDTWDMKPDAPAEVRGRVAPIATNVTGRGICERFPLTSRILDKIARAATTIARGARTRTASAE